MKKFQKISKLMLRYKDEIIKMNIYKNKKVSFDNE